MDLGLYITTNVVIFGMMNSITNSEVSDKSDADINNYIEMQ